MNALAFEACFEDAAGRDRSRPIASEAIQEAREQLILRRVIEPLLAGASSTTAAITNDDIQYVSALSLVKESTPITIANPIYGQLISREFISGDQAVGF